MSVDIKHIGRIDENGKKIYYNPSLYREQIDLLRGQEFVEIIKKKHQKVTNNQYGYYYGCILPICHKTNEFIHYDIKEDIHEDYFAELFLRYDKVIELNGEKKLVSKMRGIETLSKEEMIDFITRVIHHCDELGISIPPSELQYNKYYQK